MTVGQTVAVGPPAAPATRERYELLDTIGQGSSAVVYKVHDRELDEVIALKALAPALAGDARVVERLKREIRIARRVRHPNVARVYDLEEWQGRLCISMEYLPGETLFSLLKQGPLPVERAAAILLDLAQALEAAHALGVVHRDLKPANVILDRNGRAYVLDFGIAVGPGNPGSAATNVLLGTPNYMAPERWRGNADQAATDLYSLGILGYEMVAGVPPFRGSSLRFLMSQHLHAPVPPLSGRLPDLPPAYERLVRWLLAKQPEERPASIGPVIQALRHLLPRREPRGDAAGQRGKVMVVDDEPVVRLGIAALLRARGASVVEAGDGHQALELAALELPDLVLLDIAMPGLDGVEALRLLKSHAALAARPVVMLTGSLDPDHPALSRGLGAVAYLNKPVNPDVLDLVLDKYLSG